MQKYDVFISYRRDGGDVTAKHLRDALTERGYRVFLDVESLRNGPFNEALYEVIENTKDFLLILPPNGLDRCVNENDWVRLEIEHAKACNRNIVPVMLKGFSFPEELPESIDFVRFQSAPPSLEINFFDAFVDKLQTFLTSRPHPLRKRILTLSVAVLLLCAAGFGLYYCISTYPLKREDKNLVSSLISYTSLNLTRLDLAGDRYIKELDRALSSAEGKTSDSDIKIQYELFEYSKEIREQADMITALPDSLRQQLLQSPFDVGNLDAFKPALVTVMTEYADNLDYIRESLIGNDGLRAEHKAEYIGILKEMAELDAEMLFYQLNESLLPVTNDDALSLLKTEMLPRMTFLYAGRLDLTHDKEALMQKEEAIFQQYEKLVSRYEESVERELDNIDTEQIRDQLEMLTNLRELTGADTGELEERLRGILNKTKQLVQGGKIIQRQASFWEYKEYFTTDATYEQIKMAVRNNSFDGCPVTIRFDYNRTQSIFFQSGSSWTASFDCLESQSDKNYFRFHFINWEARRGVPYGVDAMNVLETTIEKILLAIDYDTLVENRRMEIHTKTKVF